MLRFVLADITTIAVDAVVNAANESLSDGAGVNGAIHRAAGPELSAACREVAPCPTGEARITPGFALPARFIIHAVGPVWRGGDHGEAELLASAYRNSVLLAAEYDLASIAFPAISCGIFGYPVPLAARTAVEAVRGAIPGTSVETVTFALFGSDVLVAFESAARTA